MQTLGSIWENLKSRLPSQGEIQEYLGDAGLRRKKQPQSRIRETREEGRLILPEYWDVLEGEKDPYFNRAMVVLGVIAAYLFIVLVPLGLLSVGTKLFHAPWIFWLVVIPGLPLSFLTWPSRNWRLGIFLTLSLVVLVTHGGWLAFLFPFAYLVFLFLPGKYLVLLPKDHGWTIERFGVPVREYGKIRGIAVCFFFEKSRPFFSRFLEIQYEDRFQCSDDIMRPVRVEFPLRVARNWAIQRLVGTEVLEFAAKEDGSLEPPEEGLVRKVLTDVFSADLRELVMDACREIPFPDDPKHPKKMNSFRTELGEKIKVAAKEFFRGAMEIGPIGVLVFPSKAEQAESQRVTASKFDAQAINVKIADIYKNLTETAPNTPGESTDDRNARLHKTAIELATRDLEREGLAASGGGLAAGRATGKRQKR